MLIMSSKPVTLGTAAPGGPTQLRTPRQWRPLAGLGTAFIDLGPAGTGAGPVVHSGIQPWLLLKMQPRCLPAALASSVPSGGQVTAQHANGQVQRASPTRDQGRDIPHSPGCSTHEWTATPWAAGPCPTRLPGLAEGRLPTRSLGSAEAPDLRSATRRTPATPTPQLTPRAGWHTTALFA